MTDPKRPTRLALRNAVLIDGERTATGQTVIVRGDRIEAILPERKLSAEADVDVIDLQNAYLAPGFIDLQLNGCGGVLFNDAITVETLETMHRTNLDSGTTEFLPTLVTTSEDNMRLALEVVGQYRRNAPNGVLGIHLEGPYINPERKGIHDARFIRKPSREMVECIAAAAGDFPVMLTLAPECNEMTTVSALVEAGVIVSSGHSNAHYGEAAAGFDAGIRLATHLFNAMSPWTGRDPGVVGAILEREEVAAGIIVDGFHVHYASIKLAKGIKRQGLFLVTDAVTPTGTSMAAFQLGGRTVFVKEGRCLSADGTLGGALLTMIEAVANSVRHAGIPLLEAVRMATLYPARVVKRDHELGKVMEGYLADLTVFDDDFVVRGVVERGKWVPRNFQDQALPIKPAPTPARTHLHE
jgi:N-acetylglucosamine-6-phosphate deacetylase